MQTPPPRCNQPPPPQRSMTAPRPPPSTPWSWLPIQTLTDATTATTAVQHERAGDGAAERRDGPAGDCNEGAAREEDPFHGPPLPSGWLLGGLARGRAHPSGLRVPLVWGRLPKGS
eukprot:357105-Chlamydomonas_euryale.AAC.2